MENWLGWRFPDFDGAQMTGKTAQKQRRNAGIRLRFDGLSTAAARGISERTLGLTPEDEAIAAQASAWTNPEAGQKMPDGSIYAGVAAGGEQVFTLPEDLDGLMNFEKAQECAARLNRGKALGHDDWRLPTREELTLLFNNKARIAGLDSKKDIGWPVGAYLSSTPAGAGEVWGRYFPRGNEERVHCQINSLGVRYVRTQMPGMAT
jgi:hypothetical protein